jgi:hypothetical protein
MMNRRLSRRDLFSSFRRPIRDTEQPTPTPAPEVKSPEIERQEDPIPIGAEAVTAIIYRIAAEPAFYRFLYLLLDFCQAPRHESEISSWMLPFPEMRTSFYTPAILVNWMIRAGGIALIEDQGEQKWVTTEAGRTALEYNNPELRVQQLLEEDARYTSIYLQVLEFCASPRSREEIEELLKGNPALENPALYPNHFIDRLEASGGIQWLDKWQTTDAGLTFINKK